MNRTLLINRIDISDSIDEVRRIFFAIGNMGDSNLEDRIIDTVKNYSSISDNDLILKYSGIELNLAIKDIPILTREFSNKDIEIYSIYEVYSPII